MSVTDDPLDFREAPDLNDMDENEQAHEVYAWAGLALYYGQVFEQGLIHTLYAGQVVDGSLLKTFGTLEKFDAIVDKQTAGALIRRLRQHVMTETHVDDTCDEALRRRNFVVHHFFSERSELFARQDGRQLMIEELRQDIIAFRKADEQLS